MTEGQRDYLADLALKKGVSVEDTDNRSSAWASRKIEELKALPDAEFGELTDNLRKAQKRLVAAIVKELEQWTFQRRH